MAQDGQEGVRFEVVCRRSEVDIPVTRRVAFTDDANRTLDSFQGLFERLVFGGPEDDVFILYDDRTNSQGSCGKTDLGQFDQENHPCGVDHRRRW